MRGPGGSIRIVYEMRTWLVSHDILMGAGSLSYRHTSCAVSRDLPMPPLLDSPSHVLRMKAIHMSFESGDVDVYFEQYIVASGKLGDRSKKLQPLTCELFPKHCASFSCPNGTDKIRSFFFPFCLLLFLYILLPSHFCLSVCVSTPLSLHLPLTAPTKFHRLIPT